MSTSITLPRRPKGRPSRTTDERYRTEVRAFCRAILEIASTLDFKVSSRGWGYILEEHGVGKGNLDTVQKLINDCRKSGDLPLDICAEDNGRQAEHVEDPDDRDAEEYAYAVLDYLGDAHLAYTPLSFWDDLDTYVEMAVEKVDLKNLFSPVCEPFRIALTNIRGWNDLNSRVAMMRRFAEREAEGKRIVLLYCGDHDPGGLVISDFLLSNMADLSGAIGWRPDNLHIERFGLNADFILRHRLPWVSNLETSAGSRLDDPKHPDHAKSYVQDYLARFGARKVEANALVVRPEAGRELCRQAILRYVPEDTIAAFEAQLEAVREELRQRLLAEIDLRIEGGRL